MGEVVPALHDRHLGRRWQDRDGDIWQEHPDEPGMWQLVHVRSGFTAATSACSAPGPMYGPYREAPPDA